MKTHHASNSSTKTLLLTIAASALLFAFASCATSPDPAAASRAPVVSTARPAEWARPMEVDGLPNLHKVSDALYRSAQPTAEGMQNAKDMGVKTVVNLRFSHSDRDEIGETGLAYEHIYFAPWDPEDEEVVRFLQIVTDADRVPVLVHCKHGADRTGTMCAIYRIIVQGWDKEAAIREMVEGNYNFHSVWSNLLRYIRALDVEDIARRAGLAEPMEVP